MPKGILHKKETLYTAQTLADFANLKVSDEEPFKSKHPDFIPRAWWSIRVIGADPLWLQHQRTLHQLWADDFPFDLSLRLIVAGSGPWDLMDEQDRIVKAAGLQELKHVAVKSYQVPVSQ